MKAVSRSRDVKTLELLALDTLRAHPHLVPLYERRETLLKRQEALAAALDGAREAVDRLELEAGATLAGSATPETWEPDGALESAQQRITALEVEARIVAHALRKLDEDVTDAQDEARVELVGLYSRQVAEHIDRVVEALDAAIVAWSSLTTTIRQGQKVLGVGGHAVLDNQLAQHPLAQLREILVMRRPRCRCEEKKVVS
jgi:hypothetical protein